MWRSQRASVRCWKLIAWHSPHLIYNSDQDLPYLEVSLASCNSTFISTIHFLLRWRQAFYRGWISKPHMLNSSAYFTFFFPYHWLPWHVKPMKLIWNIFVYFCVKNHPLKACSLDDKRLRCSSSGTVIAASLQLTAIPGARAVQTVQWTCIMLCVGISRTIYFPFLSSHPVTAASLLPYITLVIPTIIPKWIRLPSVA